MLIRPSLDVPHVLRRSLEAFRAGDPVVVAEAFDTRARLVTQVDRKLARCLGIADVKGPLIAQGAVGIMKFYALEMTAFDITHLEVVSLMRAGRDVAAVCDWGIKLRGSGATMNGTCHNIWTLDGAGRKVVDGRSVCKIITPDWDHEIN